MISRKEAAARIAAGGTITLEELTEITSKRGRWSAEESERFLKACPEWVEQARQREEKRKALEAQFRIEEDPLIRDLATAGYEVGSVYDLVNTSASYPRAISVLLDHLERPYHHRIREGIVRALTVREARGIAGDAMIKRLQPAALDDHGFRFVVANALTIVADSTNVSQIERLIDDPAYEDVHIILEKALATASKAGARNAIAQA